jgi:hypothetical protein
VLDKHLVMGSTVKTYLHYIQPFLEGTCCCIPKIAAGLGGVLSGWSRHGSLDRLVRVVLLCRNESYFALEHRRGK